MKKRMIGLSVVLAVLTACLPMVVCAGDLSIAFERIEGKPETELTAIVSFNMAAQALGAFQLKMSYDPKKVQVQVVQPGDSPYFSRLISKIDNAAGFVDISGFQGASLTEPTGDIILARLRIEVNGGIFGEDLFRAEKAEFLSPQGTRIALK